MYFAYCETKESRTGWRWTQKAEWIPEAAGLVFTFTVVHIAYWCSQRLPVAPQCVWRYINVVKYQASVIITANGEFAKTYGREWILSREHFCWIATYRALNSALSLDNPAGVDRIELWFLLALSCRITCIEVSNCFFTFMFSCLFDVADKLSICTYRSRTGLHSGTHHPVSLLLADDPPVTTECLDFMLHFTWFTTTD